MATLTRLKLGPQDQGRRLTLEEFDAAEFASGSKYEYIAGRIDVSPAANLYHDDLNLWVFFALSDYWRAFPDHVRRVTQGGRVFVPGFEYETCPEPDCAVFKDYHPRETPPEERDWRAVSPILVVEIVSPGSEKKDFERNVGLYVQVPTIQEYWIVDQRPDPAKPSMTVYKRGRGARWKEPVVVPFGETYTTPLLPGFSLLIDPFGWELL